MSIFQLQNYVSNYFYHTINHPQTKNKHPQQQSQKINLKPNLNFFLSIINLIAQMSSAKDDGPAQEQPVSEKEPQAFHEYDNIMEENMEFANDMAEDNPVSGFLARIQDLQEKEEILKYSVMEHQEALKELFMKLYHRKKRLLQVATAEYNRKAMTVDIGLLEQFQELRKRIENQEAKMVKLRTQIEMQGLSGLNNDRNVIILRQKGQQISKEIESGRRFAATQYVRDHLERTHIHKVSYEDVRYEFELKNKLKEYLKSEKEAYEKKKEELKKAIEREGATKKELEDEKKRLEALTLTKQSSQGK